MYYLIIIIGLFEPSTGAMIDHEILIQERETYAACDAAKTVWNTVPADTMSDGNISRTSAECFVVAQPTLAFRKPTPH